MAAFADLNAAKFPVARMQPVSRFGGDDARSMAANNSSAFNRRAVTGGTTWSEHSYGRAIDLNPHQNPYVRGATVVPAAGRSYLDRADVRPGMLVHSGPAVAAFRAVVWGWGGAWRGERDYQHVSATGR